MDMEKCIRLAAEQEAAEAALEALQQLEN